MTSVTLQIERGKHTLVVKGSESGKELMRADAVDDTVTVATDGADPTILAALIAAGIRFIVL